MGGCDISAGMEDAFYLAVKDRNKAYNKALVHTQGPLSF